MTEQTCDNCGYAREGKPGHEKWCAQQPETDRARTMQLRALRRLSSTEVAGLGIGLAAIEACETEVLADLTAMRLAAQKEREVRVLRGLPGHGPYGRAYISARRLVQRLGLAREDTEGVLDVGKVERRV